MPKLSDERREEIAQRAASLVTETMKYYDGVRATALELAIRANTTSSYASTGFAPKPDAASIVATAGTFYDFLVKYVPWGE